MIRFARRLITAAVNAARRIAPWRYTRSDLTTVAAYLRARGVDQAWADQWGSAFGARAARAYRDATGREPLTTWETDRNGKLRRHKGYAGDASLAVAWDHYMRHPSADLADAIRH